jgi:hypothetical protein
LKHHYACKFPKVFPTILQPVKNTGYWFLLLFCGDFYHIGFKRFKVNDVQYQWVRKKSVTGMVYAQYGFNKNRQPNVEVKP